MTGAIDTAIAYAGGVSEPSEEMLAGHANFTELARLTLDGTNEAIERILALARAQLDMDLAFVAAFANGQEIFRVVDGDPETFGLAAGEGVPLEHTYCRRVVHGELPNAISDARADTRVKDLPVTAAADIGAYVGVPVRLWDGRLYGTLCCLSHTAEPSLNARDVKFMHVLARVVAEQIERQQLESEKRHVEADRIEEVLAGDDLHMVYQPIVDLEDGSLVGFEGLARFRGEPSRPPAEWFAEATEVGLRTELELAAVEAALAELDALPPYVFLALNVSPTTVVAPRLLDVIGTAADRLVIEITEHAPVDDYGALAGALGDLRARGAQVAIDDVGAGFSSLRHILRLGPEIVKLDSSLTADITNDPARRALASSLVAFAARIDARIVAEGIETEAELDVLRELGVDYGQGFHLGCPASHARR
jgi:EAL domain-containing protein (putative c-di-GMP-specific phosphodiesterase class I)